MTVIELSNNEKAATGGYTHVAHFSFANGDMVTADETHDVLTLGLGWAVIKAAFIIITPWAGGTSEVINLGIAATATASTTLINGADLTAAANTTYIDDGTGDTSAASEFLTISRGGTGTSTAGEGILLVHAVDLKTLDNFVA